MQQTKDANHLEDLLADEKGNLCDTLPSYDVVDRNSGRPKTKRFFAAVLCSVLGLSLLHLGARNLRVCSSTACAGVQENLLSLSWSDNSEASPVCPQSTAITPQKNGPFLDILESEFATNTFRLKAYESLGGAIRVETVVYDDLEPPGQDERWEVFGDLHVYLEQRFPLVHQHLKKTYVNTYALVYHWQGSDDSLKPALLTAHQDVVPVEPLTRDDWQHPPFSGFYDGEYIWGRGSCDDKAGLVGTLTAVEELLRIGFKPTRSVVLAYGMDEERGGISGATAIRDYLLGAYGENGFSILIDEGGGYIVGEDIITSSPAVVEKGKFDVRFEISAPGGHSSVPPEHTSIGMIAAVIKQLEDNPHVAHLNRSGVYYTLLQCQAEHDPALTSHLRKLITASRSSDEALCALEAELARLDPNFRALAGTTQAANVVGGGVKANALPERAFVVVNHRIDVHSSVGLLKERIMGVVLPVAERFGLDVDAFSEKTIAAKGSSSKLKLRISDAFGTALEPSPVTPLGGDSGPFQLLSGTIIGVLGASNRTGYDKKTFVAPGVSTWNTDTRHYWKLTKHIFRYGHINLRDAPHGVHSVNESLRGEGFIEAIRFFTWVILNVDETPLLE